MRSFLSSPRRFCGFHRELFRVFWKHKSKVHRRKPRLSSETIALIKQMAANNRLWGAERIRGELLKLEIRVSKRTIQKDMKHVRAIPAGWTELENVPAPSCGRGVGLRFLTGDRSLLPSAFCLFPHRVAVAEGHPCECDTHSDRSLGCATAAGSDSVGTTPKYLIRDTDRKFGPNFAQVATTSGINVLRTPYRTRAARMPCVNAFWEA